ncbi:MAG: hypothetical protein HY921_04500 [Elusimicrobia bacterium]|nr:hypothetical protein [Elusimicrobiota bacterium]
MKTSHGAVLAATLSLPLAVQAWADPFRVPAGRPDLVPAIKAALPQLADSPAAIRLSKTNLEGEFGRKIIAPVESLLRKGGVESSEQFLALPAEEQALKLSGAISRWSGIVERMPGRLEKAARNAAEGLDPIQTERRLKRLAQAAKNYRDYGAPFVEPGRVRSLELSVDSISQMSERAQGRAEQVVKAGLADIFSRPHWNPEELLQTDPDALMRRQQRQAIIAAAMSSSRELDKNALGPLILDLQGAGKSKSSLTDNWEALCRKLAALEVMPLGTKPDDIEDILSNLSGVISAGKVYYYKAQDAAGKAAFRSFREDGDRLQRDLLRLIPQEHLFERLGQAIAKIEPYFIRGGAGVNPKDKAAWIELHQGLKKFQTERQGSLKELAKMISRLVESHEEYAPQTKFDAAYSIAIVDQLRMIVVVLAE